MANAGGRLTLPVVALLSMGAAAPKESALAGFEPLVARPSSTALCSRDRVWCVDPSGERGRFIVTANGKKVAHWVSDVAEDTNTLKPLPRLLRLPDGSALIPVELRTPVMYSGGGGEIVTLRLLQVRPGTAPRAVLNVPWKTDLMIRACFSEKDEAARAGACHDEYQFDGQLTALKTVNGGMPAFIYKASAQSFPRGVSRDMDSLTLPPLKKRDLVWVADRGCSYQRSFSFDRASRRLQAECAPARLRAI